MLTLAHTQTTITCISRHVMWLCNHLKYTYIHVVCLVLCTLYQKDLSTGPLHMCQKDLNTGPLHICQKDLSTGPLHTCQKDLSTGPLHMCQKDLSTGPLHTCQKDLSTGPLHICQGRLLSIYKSTRVHVALILCPSSTFTHTHAHLSAHLKTSLGSPASAQAS